MSKSLIRILAIGLGFAFIVGCSPKIVFTPELHAKLNRDSVDLNKVQFYNSEEIYLSREEFKDEEVAVKRGQIRFEKGKFIEEIIIKKHTPGICVGDSTYHLDVSFENENDRYLQFGRLQTSKLAPYYKLYGLKWSDGVGIVHYGDTLYATQAGAGSSVLLVKKSQIYNLIKEKRVAKGRRVNK
ncbi:MAG: hypothetical protein JEZ03_01610 [Bacteroidales bacterium]|nr:hypothetical protein [Bacteroidales bacterium]